MKTSKLQNIHSYWTLNVTTIYSKDVSIKNRFISITVSFPCLISWNNDIWTRDQYRFIYFIKIKIRKEYDVD